MIKFTDQKFKRVCHITCDSDYCKNPINLVLTNRYDDPICEDLSIAEVEELIKHLQLAVEKAKLLNKPESDEDE